VTVIILEVQVPREHANSKAITGTLYSVLSVPFKMQVNRYKTTVVSNKRVLFPPTIFSAEFDMDSGGGGSPGIDPDDEYVCWLNAAYELPCFPCV
jgi:hypothetical protein